MENNTKIMLGREDYYKKVLESVEILAKLVKLTLGPDGVPVLLQRQNLSPLITKDGVTVAKSISVEDQSLNQIIEAIREAALKTNEIAGDGTTTAIVLVEAIIKESLPYLFTKQISPQRLANALNEFCDKLLEKLKTLSIKINDDLEKLKQVAYISCNGDEEISEIIISALDKVGIDGVINIQESLGSEVSLTFEEGFAIEKGLQNLSIGNSNRAEQILINNKLNNTCEFENAAVILYSGIVDNLTDFVNGISKITCSGQVNIPIVVFAHDFTDSIINFTLVNTQEGRLKLLLVKIPMLGSHNSQSNVISDLCALTGGKVIYSGPESFSKIENDQSDYLGGAEKVVAYKNRTIVYRGKGSVELIQDRANQIREDLNSADNEWDKQILRERLGRLVGGICSVKVGGITELEAKERKDRIEDALNATRVALEDGIIPGGGLALLKAFWKQKFSDDQWKNSDIKIACDIFEKVSAYPLKQIISNVGIDSPDVIFASIKNHYLNGFPLNKGNISNTENYGYDARSRSLENNIFEKGIVDPLKVVYTALSQANSIASTIIRTGGAVVFEKTIQKSLEEMMSSNMSL